LEIIKKSIIKLYDGKYFPFVILAIGMMIFHFAVPLGTYDDVWFGEVLQRTDILSFLISRYNEWSSRVLIEAALVIMVHYETVWRICNLILVVLTAIVISKIFVKTNIRSTNWILTALMFLYPISQMGSTGWIATTLNYFWPLAFGLIAIIPIKKILNKEKIAWFEYVVYTISMVYSINQEQMCLVLLAVYGVFLIYQIINRKVCGFAIFSLALCISSLIFILTCPGNLARKIAETGKWFPEFENLNLIRKIEMGFSSSLYEFVMKPNFVFIVFCGLLFISVVLKNQKKSYRAIAAIPFVSSIVFGLFGSAVGAMFPGILKIINSMTKIGTSINFLSVSSWMPDLILLIVCFSVIISLFLTFEKKVDSLLVIFILLLGFGTRMVMSFSPTIWASGTRTFIFMYFSLIIISVILYNNILKNKNIKFMGLFALIIGTIAFLSFANNVMEL